MREQAASAEGHERFVSRVVESEEVWSLRGENGAAWCPSNYTEDRPVLMFWSDRAYAERSRKTHFPDYKADPIPLFDFLFRWLSGMANDGVLVGTNWTGQLVGLEIEPDGLKAEILGRLPGDVIGRYREQLAAGLEQQQRSE